eukprot:CAMPEP_0181288136 /NCGR_PEP_ID=MMETSP1101-20121128/167_1 /TAXON_ID=46948 /ORGANISM="Rhodomonas abbreviata, Strain Caron Lab Isolate" /LENGTH=127 /DNA_ID=CAMNT_0023392229 /DNA_START=280 /DNA_END=663 /DNA_ORIENTATION=+
MSSHVDDSTPSDGTSLSEFAFEMECNSSDDESFVPSWEQVDEEEGEVVDGYSSSRCRLSDLDDDTAAKIEQYPSGSCVWGGSFQSASKVCSGSREWGASFDDAAKGFLEFRHQTSCSPEDKSTCISG